ncbi:MAG: glycosyltransferase family 4 protein [Thermodesulfobacteriota bacterium]
MGGLRSWHIGRQMVREGCEVEAIIPAVDTLSGHRRWRGIHFVKKESIDGVTINWVVALGNNRKSKFSRITYFISNSIHQAVLLLFVSRPDAVVSMSFPLSAVFINFLYARMCRVPFVIDVRDTHIDSALATGYIRENRLVRLFKRLEAWIFRKADLNITVTQGMADILAEKGVVPKKQKVVPLGYDGAHCYDGYVDWNRDIRAEMGLQDKFVALYQGTLGYVFDLDTILGAAEILKDHTDIVFVFAGGGQRLAALRSRARQKGLNARFLGLLPKHEVALLCRQADVALYAVRDEKPLKAILGNKVYDYLGNGTPIVNASQNGEVEALIERTGGGRSVPSGDAMAMAAEICALKADPAKLRQMGRDAEAYIGRHMTAEIYMNTFGRAIRQMLGQAR